MGGGVSPWQINWLDDGNSSPVTSLKTWITTIKLPEETTHGLKWKQWSHCLISAYHTFIWNISFIGWGVSSKQSVTQSMNSEAVEEHRIPQQCSWFIYYWQCCVLSSSQSFYEKQRLVDKPVTWHNEIVHGVHLLRALWLAQLFHVALYERVYLTSKEKNTQWQRHGSQLCAYNGVFWVKPLPCCVVLWPVCMLQIGWGADTEYCCLAAELQMMGALSAASLFSFTMILVLFTVF